MHIVAIRELPAGFEALVPALAPVIGSAPAVLAARLRAAGRGPIVVATAADPAAAAALADSVAAAGFRTILLDAADAETDAARFLVRKPAFREDLLRGESRSGEVRELRLPTIALIVRGTRGESSAETATTRERKLSPARILLSGGMMLTKTVETTTRRLVDLREGFAHLYAPGAPPVVLREAALVYDDFGLPRQPSRAANFAALVAEVRRHCRAATFDDRLLTRAGQVRVLGPSLAPEEHLDVAITLLAAVLR